MATRNPGRSRRAAPAAGTVRVRKNMDMDPGKLRAAQKILGAKTETEAVDRALDAVIGKDRVRAALQRLRRAGGLRDITVPTA